MVEPEDRVEAGVGDEAHVAAVTADEAVNGVVHVFEGVVGGAAGAGEGGVGEGGVVGLVGEEFVGAVVDGLGVGLEGEVGEVGLALPGDDVGGADGAGIFGDCAVTGREIRGGRMGVEGVVVQGVGDGHDALGRVHGYGGIVDRIWHRDVGNPVPVWDP